MHRFRILSIAFLLSLLAACGGGGGGGGSGVDSGGSGSPSLGYSYEPGPGGNRDLAGVPRAEPATMGALEAI